MDAPTCRVCSVPLDVKRELRVCSTCDTHLERQRELDKIDRMEMSE